MGWRAGGWVAGGKKYSKCRGSDTLTALFTAGRSDLQWLSRGGEALLRLRREQDERMMHPFLSGSGG